MLHENIKQARKQKGLSQEELATRLHVVRQTVSKWETGRSLPDAEELLALSACLEVSIENLLGNATENLSGNPEKTSSALCETANNTTTDIHASELEYLRAELDKRIRKEQLNLEAAKKRVSITWFSLIAFIPILAVQNPILSVILTFACLLFAILILYRNMELLTGVTAEKAPLKALYISTGFTIIVTTVCTLVVVFTSADIITFTEYSEKLFVTLLITCVFIFISIISPKLPHNRHTGLRLPWTVMDADTWNLAHRIIGYIGLPIALMYLACALTINNFETVTVTALLAYIGIPGGISYVFFRKKYR